MVGKTNSINLLGGGDTQTANYITVADTLGNLVQAFKNGDTSAYFTPLKQQCDIWLSSGNGNVNFVPKPCIISFTDSKLLLSKYNSMTYGSQYAHLYRFSGLLEGRVYYEVEIGILTSTATTETASSNYEVADVYVSDYSFVDDNITIGNSSVDTSGTITEEQLAALEGNDHKLIDFYGELFIKMDTRTHNQLVYTCLKNDTVPIVKFITINTSNRNWVLTQKAIVEEEKVMTDAFTISLEDMKSAVNGKKTYRQTHAPSAIRNFILAQEGTFDLTITTPLGALGMTLYPSLWKDGVNNSRNFEGVITIDTDLSTIGGSNQLNQIVCTAIAWTTEGSTAVDYRYTIIPIEEQASPSGGKYSNHLHYDIHLEGSWDTSNQIMTLDTASQNAIKVVLDKLEELTTGDNYDFLVNMRVAGKASAEGDIAVIGANMKLNYVPGISALGVYRNLQTQFILSGNASDTANIVISDTEFTSNSQMFHTFMSSMYVVFQFDINY